MLTSIIARIQVAVCVEKWHPQAASFFKLINQLLAVLGLRCCAQAFSSRGEQGLLLLQSTGSRARAQWLWHMGLIAREIFLDQGSNLRTLHWQADSYPLRHQGSPATSI